MGTTGGWADSVASIRVSERHLHFASRRRSGTRGLRVPVMRCIYNSEGVFDWDGNNLKKIRAHRIDVAEVEEALAREPILIYEQTAAEEARYVYYGETGHTRLLAIVITERQKMIQ